MWARVTGIAVVGLLVSSGAWAQEQPRLELSGFAGWTFNEGVGDPNTSLGSNIYNSFGPDDELTYGASLGVFATENLEIGVLWSRQSPALRLEGFNQANATAAGWPPSDGGTAGGGTGGASTNPSGLALATLTGGVAEYEVGELDVNTFHGILSWNFGPSDAAVRPFVFGGAGVTRYGDVEYDFPNVSAGQVAGGTSRVTINGRSEFSTTWGAGVKIAPTRGLGVRLTGRWTPTRLDGDDGNGWWCQGNTGCFTAGERDYSSQFTVTGGLTLRF